jgi:hypothetical protein
MQRVPEFFGDCGIWSLRHLLAEHVKINKCYPLAGLLLAGAGWLPAALVSGAGAPAVDFVHQVQPILKESCYACHGPEKSKAGLRLDSKARAVKGGENGRVILPGDSAASPLVQRLISTNEDERMPQKAAPLSGASIRIIRDWIDQGAIWPEAVAGGDPAKHWAFQRLTDPQPPRVKNRRWARNPIDNFVLAKLEGLHLAPNLAAPRRAQIRRAYLDLLGLPPSPEEVEAFVSDHSADAYPRLLDRLLANPHYGERWARQIGRAHV